MSTKYKQFAQQLTKDLVENEHLDPFPGSDSKVQVTRGDNEIVTLDMTPFEAQVQPVSAREYFSRVKSLDDLLQAYRSARNEHMFEAGNSDAMRRVSPYAQEFLETIFSQARNILSDNQAIIVANWISNLDIYTAVKSIESLLNSKADLALLELADSRQWSVHFDHLAIRCGSKKHRDAERVVEMLKTHHGYVSAQVESEAYYQFTDGWNAYPLYKILENGQVLRLFIDQSDADNTTQIIQHWNRVYGYTAHHLAIRATMQQQGQRVAVTLEEVMQALQENGIDILTPTGHYTAGMLLQVFTRPEKNTSIPTELVDELASYSEDLNKMIENGKLLELVSRKEMPATMAKEFFNLYGVQYDSENPLHSAPYYQYFLPAQAAHVIKTSVQVG